VNIAATPLQAAGLTARDALDQARCELDADTFQVFLAMLGVVVARWEGERLEDEWRAAA
jgi:hypothetical protein